MERRETEITAIKRTVWNAGRAVGAKRALKPKQIWEIRFYLNQRRRLRDRALFDLAIDSKLRGCDLARLKIGDLVSGGQIRTRAIVMQQKTGCPDMLAQGNTARRNSGRLFISERGGATFRTAPASERSPHAGRQGSGCPAAKYCNAIFLGRKSLLAR